MIWHTDLKVNVSNNKNNSLLKVPPPSQNQKLIQAYKTGQREQQQQKQEQENKKFKDLLRAYWQMYCEKSTVHGVRYMYDPTLRGIER